MRPPRRAWSGLPPPETPRHRRAQEVWESTLGREIILPCQMSWLAVRLVVTKGRRLLISHLLKSA